MKVNAAVLHEIGAPLSVETLDLAAPRSGEVLVRIGASGVCHSDYHVISGQAGHPLPVALLKQPSRVPILGEEGV